MIENTPYRIRIAIFGVVSRKKREEGIFGVIFFFPSTASFPHSILQSLPQGQKSLGDRATGFYRCVLIPKKEISEEVLLEYTEVQWECWLRLNSASPLLQVLLQIANN